VVLADHRAHVGVATANLYPQISLSGSYGSEAVTSGTLFSSRTAVWSLGAGVLQPLFHGGELNARRRAAVAAYDQASAQYQEMVMLAFQNVADVLRTLEADARTLKAQADAEAAARFAGHSSAVPGARWMVEPKPRGEVAAVTKKRRKREGKNLIQCIILVPVDSQQLSLSRARLQPLAHTDVLSYTYRNEASQNTLSTGTKFLHHCYLLHR
jgi:hypothetical protein